jgi:hypothetical protein
MERVERGVSKMEPKRNATDVLHAANEILQTAQWGLADLCGSDPRRRLSGLRNVIIWERAVTNVLQTLRSAVGEQVFNDWYEPEQAEMQEDELLQYFYKLRSEILKEGKLHTSPSMYIKRLNTSDLQPVMQNPPPGAQDFFVGDQVGGSGWVVKLADGTTEKYYVELPPEVQSQITTTLHFANPPQSHLGAPLQDTSVEALAQHYLAYLTDLVDRARKQFASVT